MSIAPYDSPVRTCVICEDAPVHPKLIAHCADDHLQFLVDAWLDDDHIAAVAEDLDVELVTVEVEDLLTSSGEWTLDIGEIATVDVNGDVVGVS